MGQSVYSISSADDISKSPLSSRFPRPDRAGPSRGACPGEPRAGMCPMTTKALNANVLDPAELLKVLLAVKSGDFGARMPLHLTGLPGKVADTLNEVIQLNESMARELAR